jgi:hypothetical protein
MRHSSSFFWKALLISTTSAAVLSGCGATPGKPKNDPYERYYGQPESSAHDSVAHADIVVNPAAPRSYVVQKGDTLWGIARKFLNTPWYWPEVWDKNQRIKNPHLIYPGDVLHLEYKQGNGNKLVPRIRIDRHGAGEPISSLIPFMAWPRVLDEATIKNAPYLLASQDNHTLIGSGEKIYIKNLRNTPQGSRCALFTPKKALHDPQTGALLGYEVTYNGYSRVTRVGDPSTAIVVEAIREIRQGDRVFQPIDETAHLNAPIHAPNFKVRADVISLFDAEAVSGTHMIATINKGQRDNIQVGHTLGIYAQGKTVNDPHAMRKTREGAVIPLESQLPPEKAANLVIYKVTDKVSYGLILDATREVKTGYKVGNP